MRESSEEEGCLVGEGLRRLSFRVQGSGFRVQKKCLGFRLRRLGFARARARGVWRFNQATPMVGSSNGFAFRVLGYDGGALRVCGRQLRTRARAHTHTPVRQ